jgi:hypothetical protein
VMLAGEQGNPAARSRAQTVTCPLLGRYAGEPVLGRDLGSGVELERPLTRFLVLVLQPGMTPGAISVGTQTGSAPSLNR